MIVWIVETWGWDYCDDWKFHSAHLTQAGADDEAQRQRESKDVCDVQVQQHNLRL